MRQILVANLASWSPRVPAVVNGERRAPLQSAQARTWARGIASRLCGLLKDVRYLPCLKLGDANYSFPPAVK